MQHDDLLLGPNEQTTLLYTFNANLNLEPMEFQLAVSVTYEDEEKDRYISVALNETIPFYEPASEIDAKTFFTYGAILAVLALVAVVASRSSAQGGKSSSNASGDSGNEWLSGIVDKSSKRRVAGKSGSKKTASGKKNKKE